MRDPTILLVHLIATLARLMGPGGLRSVVAESLLVKQQLLILNRSRHRAPNLRASDRILAGVCALFMCPARCGRWIASEGGGGAARCLAVNAQAVAQEGPTNPLKSSPTFAPFSTCF